jgi:RNA 3'-terminal phosphate cyclase (ATP)
MLTLDGSMGEGGGQVVRTALGLSLCTGRPVRIEKIRARRDKAGLRAQHATAVTAATRVGGAHVVGNEIGSRTLEFTPSGAHPGVYHFDIGTAGSACLVLQTILPALMIANAPSRIVIEGGTHNQRAPSFGFLRDCFLPLIGRFGPRVSARLERHGFYPAGGGRVVFEIEPCAELSPIELLERGELQSMDARILIARLPRHVAEREIETLVSRLGLTPGQCDISELTDTRGPGNVIEITIVHERLTEVVTELGQRGVPAERVATLAAREASSYLESGAPVGSHLCDQLLIPCALAGGGTFRTLPPTLHTTTNAQVIELFLGTSFRFEPEPDGSFRVETVIR